MFMCGVCEGFYGKPWTLNQRLELFERMQTFGMNTYLYAPKDDYKHRLDWRELYSEDEADELGELIRAANCSDIKFVYAISPGLDIVYSLPSDIYCLHSKLDQVKSLGCQYFALLFDDIDDELCPDDMSRFSSIADAQCSVTNAVYNRLNEPEIFLFCPTEYCSARAEPDLDTSTYLHTVGNLLNPKIYFLWTGNKVVSQLITVDNIRTVSNIVKRKVTIWDNLHANDYDQTRVYLGPYSGRDPQLVEQLRGVLTNPNCEFHVNFVAFHTLAQWAIDCNTCFSQQLTDADNDAYTSKSCCASAGAAAAAESISGYDAGQALVMAVRDWLPELYKTTSCSQHQQPVSARTTRHQPPPTTTTDTTDMQTSGETECQSENSAYAGTLARTANDPDTDLAVHSASDSQPIPSPLSVSSAQSSGSSVSSNSIGNVSKRKVDKVKCERLTVDDVVFLCHLFYLPYDHGQQAISLLQSFHWLVDNVPTPLPADTLLPEDTLLPATAATIDDVDSDDDDDVRFEWYKRAAEFQINYRKVASAVDKLVNITNRQLLYELYTYVIDMRSTLALVNSYIKWLGCEKHYKEQFKSGDQEAWIYRGGLLAEFTRLLPIERQCNSSLNLQCKTSSTATNSFLIRPYNSSDKIAVYDICQNTLKDDIYINWSVGGLLDHSTAACYVLEDCNEIICGYAACCLSVSLYRTYFLNTWLPTHQHSDKQSSRLKLEDLVDEKLMADFPSLISVLVSQPLAANNITGRLLRCVVKFLELNGSTGVHTVLHSSQSHLQRIFLSAGFKQHQQTDNCTVLCKYM